MNPPRYNQSHTILVKWPRAKTRYNQSRDILVHQARYNQPHVIHLVQDSTRMPLSRSMLRPRLDFIVRQVRISKMQHGDSKD